MHTIRNKNRFGAGPVTVPLKTVAPNADPAMFDRRRCRFTFSPRDVQNEHQSVTNTLLGAILGLYITRGPDDVVRPLRLLHVFQIKYID